MSTGKLKFLLTASAGVLVATALLGSPRTAQAGDDDAPGCTALGCSGGSQLCATYATQVGIPGVGNVTVTFYCYQGET